MEGTRPPTHAVAPAFRHRPSARREGRLATKNTARAKPTAVRQPWRHRIQGSATDPRVILAGTTRGRYTRSPARPIVSGVGCRDRVSGARSGGDT